jgi:hypothetical protein
MIPFSGGNLSEKKPKCPKCGEELNYLHNVVYGATVTYDFWIEDEQGGFATHYDDETVEDSEKEEFCCPACGEVLTTNEDEAMALLGKP